MVGRGRGTAPSSPGVSRCATGTALGSSSWDSRLCPGSCEEACLSSCCSPSSALPPRYVSGVGQHWAASLVKQRWPRRSGSCSVLPEAPCRAPFSCLSPFKVHKVSSFTNYIGKDERWARERCQQHSSGVPRAAAAARGRPGAASPRGHAGTRSRRPQRQLPLRGRRGFAAPLPSAQLAFHPPSRIFSA